MDGHSNFKIFNVATTFTPAMVIENVLGGKAEPKGWAITEVVEKGDGAWAKVTPAILSTLANNEDTADDFDATGNNHRIRRRPRRSLALEHGLDGQTWRWLAACVGRCAQGLNE